MTTETKPQTEFSPATIRHNNIKIVGHVKVEFLQKDGDIDFAKTDICLNCLDTIKGVEIKKPDISFVLGTIDDEQLVFSNCIACGGKNNIMDGGSCKICNNCVPKCMKSDYLVSSITGRTIIYGVDCLCEDCKNK